MAMLQAAQAQRPVAAQKLNSARPGTSALARAMAGRAKVNPRDASLPALKPYGESDHADRFGPTPTPSGEAFQDTAFENDSYQVF
jgi:hypothetical protein